MRKIYPYLLILIIVLLLFPFIIGKLIVLPIDLGNIAGSESDWLLFWATYIGTSATAFMVWLTYEILCQNKNLMDSQRNMWETQNKGVLDFSLIVRSDYLICLRVENVGLSTIKDIFYSFNSEFIDCLPTENLKEYLANQGKMGLRLNPRAHRDYPIYYYKEEKCELLGNKISKSQATKIISDMKNVDIQITGSYITLMKEYPIDEKFKSENYLTNSIIDVDEVAIELKSITKELTRIKASLQAKK